MITVLAKKLDWLMGKVLVASLAGMLGLSFLSIVLRWFSTSLLWIDPIVRHLVLVAAFAGGALAVAKKNHIRIDLAAKLIEKSPRQIQAVIEKLVQLSAVLATAGLLWSGWTFFLMEQEFGNPIFFHLHSSALVFILPLGWAVVTLRWALELFSPRGA